MRLKEIKPGMVIHCKTEDEAIKLIEEAYKQGYEWNGNGNIDDTFWNSYEDMCYRFNDDITITYGSLEYFTNEYGANRITEFSDLIIPELTAEEAIEWLSIHYLDGAYIKAFGGDYETYNILNYLTPSEIVEKIAQWKSTHEQKEPEVEWFWKGYVVGGSDFKEADTEQEAMEWCENYVKEHPGTKCTYKHVCRVN